MEERIEKTIKNLEKNQMEPYWVDRAAEILPLLQRLIPAGATVGLGGSKTLNEIGAVEFLRQGDYRLFDRYRTDLNAEEIGKVIDQSLTADVFLSSSNAVTENGELYNVDGRGNRVAAICYGPKSVIIVAGINKLVPDLAAAELRVKQIAAPKNAARLSCDTPCIRLGHCVSLSGEKQPALCDGCAVDGRICCSYLVSAHQRVKNRIKVILCGESLGY